MKIDIPLALLLLGIPALLAYGWLHSEDAPAITMAPGEHGDNHTLPAGRSVGTERFDDQSARISTRDPDGREVNHSDPFDPAGLNRGSDESNDTEYDAARRLMAKELWSEAIVRLESVVGRAPSNVNAWVDLAFVSLKRGSEEDLQRALGASTRVTKLDSTRMEAWYNVACAHAKLGNPTEALEALARAFELDAEYVREMSARDNDLDSLRSNPRFQQILDGGSGR